MKQTELYEHTNDQSVKEKQKRFYRTNNRSTSRSISTKSNKHQSSPLSKFYVKNVSSKSKINQTSRLFNQSLANSAKSKYQTQTDQFQNLGKKSELIRVAQNQNCEKLKQQIQFLKAQVKKCHSFIKTHNESCLIKNNETGVKHSLVLNKQLQQEISKNWRLQKENSELKNRVQRLEQKKTSKQNCKNLKNSILESRVQQYEQQINKLKNQNSELRKIIKVQNQDLFKQNITNKNEVLTYDKQQINRLLRVKYDLENQIKHLCIQHNTEIMKMKQQMDQLKHRKQKEYIGLKNKFLQYMAKYREKYTELFHYESPTKHKCDIFGVKNNQQQDNNSLNFSMSQENDQI